MCIHCVSIKNFKYEKKFKLLACLQNRILLAGIVIYYYWEAMLISYLSTRFIALPFKNIKDLVENSDFKIALIKGTSYDDAFKLSTDPIWQKAYSERIEPFLDKYSPFYENMNEVALKDESVAIYFPFGSGR